MAHRAALLSVTTRLQGALQVEAVVAPGRLRRRSA